jgi:formate hydrogenlyase subunit 3/multisubunit Na+/H+ antiporter MnhD subunit
MNVSRFLIMFGLIILAIGLLWPVLSKLGLGRLPGDIVLEGKNYSFYFPIVTSLILSIVLSVIWSIVSR